MFASKAACFNIFHVSPIMRLSLGGVPEPVPCLLVFLLSWLVCSAFLSFLFSCRFCSLVFASLLAFLSVLFLGFSASFRSFLLACLFVAFLDFSWLFLSFLGFSLLILAFPGLSWLFLAFLVFSWLFCFLVSHVLAFVYHPVVFHLRSGSSIASFDKLSAA